jgi:glycosyltransferase involved in cell wall biosynthesis
MQDYPHELMEVIFVDDGSEDQTLSIIRNHASKMDMKVKIFHHKWKGLGFSRNVVVKNARGKYIVWVDGDIIIPSDHVRKQVEFMEKNEKVAIAGGSFELLPTLSSVAFLDNLSYILHRKKLKSGKIGNLPGTGGAIYRVDSIRKLGGFDEKIIGSGEDIDAAYRAKAAGWIVERDKASFYGECKETWRELWLHYVWHGYGAHFVKHKHKNIISLTGMLPFIAIFTGLIDGVIAYKLTHRSVSFLFPFHKFFKTSAWLVGFLKSHFDGYGHNLK